MFRFGLCCLFKEKPVKFRRCTAKYMQKLDQPSRLKRISELCLHNSKSLLQALETADRLKIRAFRVMTPLFPLYTHPSLGYILDDLPEHKEILATLQAVKKFKTHHDIRLSLHPDQFNVLNSPRPEVVKKSIEELEYQAFLAELIDADVINIHLGGVYGDKQNSCRRFIENYELLSERLKKRLSIENDDRSYTPEDLAAVSKTTGIPIVYDVHHHRCNSDSLSEKEATDLSIKTWKLVDREAYFHISSPQSGWDSKNEKAHADFIDINDFPHYWRELETDVTIDVEAKSKELAVLRLQKELELSDVVSQH